MAENPSNDLFFTYVGEAKNDELQQPIIIEEPKREEEKIEEIVPKEPEAPVETSNPRSKQSSINEISTETELPPQPPQPPQAPRAETARKPSARTGRGAQTARYKYRSIVMPKNGVKYIPPPKPSRREIKQKTITQAVMCNPMALPSSTDDLDLLISKLREDYKLALIDEKFPEAEDIARIINHAISKKKHLEKLKSNNKYVNEVKKHEEMIQTVKGRMDEWDNEYRVFQKTVEDHVAQLGEIDARELEEFDKTEPTVIPKQNLLWSRDLRNLRDQERFYIAQGFPGKANDIKKVADEMQREEEEEILNSLKRSFLKRREYLIEKQNTRLEAYIMKAQSHQNALIRRRALLANGYFKRIYTLGNGIEKRIQNGEMKRQEIDSIVSKK